MSTPTSNHGKRWPLKQAPLPQAGESLQREFYDVLVEKCLVWAIAAVVVFITVGMEWWRWYLPRPPHPGAVTVVAVPILAFACVMCFRGLARARQLRLGLEGEQAVGQRLEGMRAHGYEVFHDIPGRGFNVDHVLIGPAGVFVLETKTISKPAHRKAVVEYDGTRVLVDGQAPDRDPIAQVRAEADYIRELLSPLVGLRFPVRPVVLYPDWFVEKQPRGVDIWVLNPKVLAAFVLHEDPILTPREVAGLASALEQQVRSRIA